MKSNFLLLALSVVFFLGSCTPKYSILKLTPEQEILGDVDERGKVYLNHEDIVIECDFLQSTQYDLLFQLSIKNNSEKELEIIPRNFNYLAVDENGRAFAKEYAYDPESLIFDIDETIKADRKAAKEEKTLGWIFFGVNALAAVVGFANDDDYAPAYAIDAGINLAASQAGAASIEKHVVSLEGERDYYENAAIRDTVLTPGTQLEGLIIFPRFDGASQLDFEFDLSGTLFNIIYWQNWLTR